MTSNHSTSPKVEIYTIMESNCIRVTYVVTSVRIGAIKRIPRTTKPRPSATAARAGRAPAARAALRAYIYTPTRTASCPARAIALFVCQWMLLHIENAGQRPLGYYSVCNCASLTVPSL